MGGALRSAPRSRADFKAGVRSPRRASSLVSADPSEGEEKNHECLPAPGWSIQQQAAVMSLQLPADAAALLEFHSMILLFSQSAFACVMFTSGLLHLHCVAAQTPAGAEEQQPVITTEANKHCTSRPLSLAPAELKRR